MLYKNFFYTLTLIFTTTSLNVSGHSSSNDHIYTREEKLDNSCKDLPDTCRNEGTIFGGKHFTWSPFSSDEQQDQQSKLAEPPKLDAEGFPIPPEENNRNE